MATYCTVPDVRAALTPGGVQAGDSGQTAASLEDWQIRDAIDEAEGMVNGYLTGYTVPTVDFTVVDPDDPNNSSLYTAAPDPVRRWTRSIAAYLATLSFRRNKDLTDEDPIVRRYNMVMGLLADVRAGLAVLDPVAFPPVTSTGQAVAIFNLYEGTLFGPDDFNLAPDGEQHTVQRIWRAETAVN